MISRFLFERISVPDLEKSLDAYSLRQKAISNNIANVNTPCYRARKVSFEEEYQKHLEKHTVPSGQTNPRHIPIGTRDLDQVQPRVEFSESTMNDSAINNVDIDKEMAELAENNIRYEMSINLIKKKFANLNSSIKGQPVTG